MPGTGYAARLQAGERKYGRIAPPAEPESSLGRTFAVKQGLG
jgi:hypothetical protein